MGFRQQNRTDSGPPSRGAGGALCTPQGPGRTPRRTQTVMSAAFHPDSTRQNHPDWVVDPVVDWERTTERRKQRKFLKHWSTRGSGSVDRATPEPFTWVKERQKKHPNVTTQKINQSRFEDSIARENAKISHKIKQMRGVRRAPSLLRSAVRFNCFFASVPFVPGAGGAGSGD
jgi:hypothetical protein